MCVPVAVKILLSCQMLSLNSSAGIGYQTAKALCNKGYNVVIACRDPQRAANAVASLKQEVPSASIDYLQLDLANLQSVRDAANKWLDSGRHIDVLLNNAGAQAARMLSHYNLCKVM